VADDPRPEYQHGVGTIGSTQFHWGSGMPGKYWSIPYGDYPVTPNAPTGAWAHQAGAIPIANNVIPDPQLGRNRIGIMIHSGSAPSLDQLYTEGCFKVDPQEWPTVRSQILAQADKGPLYLHVAPGGIAAFTNTKTFSQAGDQTPAATANVAANTTAAPGTGINTTSPLAADHSQFITNYAKQIGVDPNLALGIANAEGLHAWSANNPNAASRIDVQNGQPFSFGDFQLNTHPGAMGAQALKAGINPQDPNQWQAADRFALDQLKAGGAAPWKGDSYAANYLKTGTAAPVAGAATPGTTINTTGAKPTGVGGVIAALTQGTGDDGKGASPLQDLQKTFQQGPSSGGSGGGAPPAPAPDLQGQMAAGMGNMRQQQIAAQAQQMLAAQQQGLAASQQLRPQVGGHLAYGLGGGLIPMANPAPTPGTTLNSTGDLYG
jgi:hypothetical protein